MSQYNLFNAAMKCIPPAEKAKNQMVTLYEGDLYFMSSTKNAWFRIKGFMQSDSNFKITVENLKIILSLGSNITATTIEGDVIRKRFSAGSDRRMDSGVLVDIDVPDLTIPPLDRFIPFPKLFGNAAQFNNMADESTRMSSIMLTTDCAAYMLENKNSVCGILYTGEDEILEGNFTTSFMAVNETVSAAGKYHKVRDLLYLHIDISETVSITSCMKLSPPLATQEAKNVVTRFVANSAFERMDGMIKASIDMSKYIEMVNVVSHMDFKGSAKFIIGDDTFKVVINDAYNREYEHVIPCETRLRVRFASYMISLPQMKVLTSSIADIKKKDNYKLDMYIMAAYSKMVVSVQGAAAGYFPFILLPIKADTPRG